jgi:hypothetical protein
MKKDWTLQTAQRLVLTMNREKNGGVTLRLCGEGTESANSHLLCANFTKVFINFRNCCFKYL